MIVYTTIASDDGCIELTRNIYTNSSDYEPISLSFKDTDVEKLEYWDNALWIRKFIDHLRERRLATISDMIDASPNKVLDVEYFQFHRDSILELWDAAKELKIV